MEVEGEEHVVSEEEQELACLVRQNELAWMEMQVWREQEQVQHGKVEFAEEVVFQVGVIHKAPLAARVVE